MQQLDVLFGKKKIERYLTVSLYLATYKTAGLCAQLQKEVCPTEVEQEADNQARV